MGWLIGKVWNGLAAERIYRWGRKDKRPVVPEMTRAEIEAEAKRRAERQQEKRGRK